MEFRDLLSVLAGLIMFYSFIPYGRDILAGKVKPARSTRLMMVLLMSISLLQQHTLGSGWLLAMTIGDFIGAVGILVLAFKNGVGGLTRLDLACYGLLAIDVMIWISTGNTLLALHLGILADVIATTPVLVKTWRQPWTETPLFFVLGVVGPILNIIAVGHYSYALIVFPAYIAFVNLLEFVLIVYRQQVVPSPHRPVQLEHQPLT